MIIIIFFLLISFINAQVLPPCVPPTPLPPALNHSGHGHETNSPTPMPPCLPPMDNSTTTNASNVTNSSTRIPLATTALKNTSNSSTVTSTVSNEIATSQSIISDGNIANALLCFYNILLATLFLQ